MSMAVMTACVASGRSAPMPLAASGPVEMSLDGMGYIVDLEPVATGAELTVSAGTGAMAMDQGLAAKRVAEAFCASRKARLDPRALGRFATGVWVFDGGCV